MSNIDSLLEEAKNGFHTLAVDVKYQQQALVFLEKWLREDQFQDYTPQIEHLIKNKYWDYLLDSFYQVIPFGTGGRRGEVGVGPNRINPWTVKSACQGHCQFLVKHYGDEAKTRGIVIAYDVREFFGNKYFDPALPNPVLNMTCKGLAIEASKVYAANGIKVSLFDDIRTTPELSFAIRHLKAVGGNVFSASHNPPEHNGQKIFDEFGGQLISPDDEKLVKEVTEYMTNIEEMDFEEAKGLGLVTMIGKEVDDAYIKAIAEISLSDARDVAIIYTPLHGCGTQNVYVSLKALGFNVELDPKTSNPSGKFENVTFNISNPEVEQAFDTSLKFAKEKNADILMASDPDSDRLGIMVNHQGNWTFLNGNQIAVVLAEYSIGKMKDKIKGRGVVIKTAVTTDLLREICKIQGVDLIGDLLVGYKYVAHEMNKLEDQGRMKDFIMGCEESHGYNTGNYARDKDSAPAAVWLAELAAELKKDQRTLVDYLEDIYAKYGYFRNYLTQIRLPGAEGKGKIDQIQNSFRQNPPEIFGRFKVEKLEDYLDRKPHLSQTDATAKNVLVFHLEPVEGTLSIKVTVRPSGTEPISKMYFEIGSEPFEKLEFDRIKAYIEQIREELEKDFMQACYKMIDIDFPDRGFLLFWQLPVTAKMRYFEIETELSEIKDEPNKELRQKQVDELLKFLGSDPIEKVDKAFQAKYHQPLKTYLDI